MKFFQLLIVGTFLGFAFLVVLFAYIWFTRDVKPEPPRPAGMTETELKIFCENWFEQEWHTSGGKPRQPRVVSLDVQFKPFCARFSPLRPPYVQ